MFTVAFFCLLKYSAKELPLDKWQNKHIHSEQRSMYFPLRGTLNINSCVIKHREIYKSYMKNGSTELAIHIKFTIRAERITL